MFDQALLVGTLALDSKNCLVVETEDGAAVVPIFDEDSTSWNAEDESLSTAGSKIRIGAQVTFGGGAGRPDNARLAAGCADDPETFRIDPNTPPIVS